MTIIPVSVPDGTSGDWQVDTIVVKEDDPELKMFNLRCIINGDGRRCMHAGTFRRLLHCGHVVMSNTPAECHDHMEPIARAIGSVLINGLGLGVVLSAILEKPTVTDVTVIEASADVIKLIAPTFAHDPRVTIVHADAYTWIPPRGARWNVVWHDVWNELCEDNLPLMTRLHRKYGRRCDWQGSWSKDYILRERRRNRGRY